MIINYSCTKDEVLAEDLNLTDEIAKIETSYKQGYVKVEFTSDSKNIEETVASSEFMKQLMATVADSYSKQKTSLKSGSTYYTKGVFKNTTCGNYQELDIFMDSEDRRCISTKSGSVGTSTVDGNGNIMLKICIIDDVIFGPVLNHHYGILNLGSQEPGVSRLVRGFDNEDSGNNNKAWIDNVEFNGTLGDCNIGSINPNTKLSFSYYDQYYSNEDLPYPWDYNHLPSLGFSYYVLASWGSGWILSDDEDSGNANYCFHERPVSPSPLTTYYNYNTTFDGVLEVGGNTKMHLSLAY